MPLENHTFQKKTKSQKHVDSSLLFVNRTHNKLIVHVKMYF